MVGFAVFQVGMHLIGLPGWSCPIKAFFGIPCPGCGLTLALDELLHGHWAASVKIHAFAPIFLAAFVVLFLGILLPQAVRAKLIAKIAYLETRTGISAWVLSLLMLYWFTRLFGLV